MPASEIKRKALQLGYIGCGIIPSSVLGEYAAQLDERVKAFPESQRLYNRLYNAANPPEDAKSVIVCTRRYNGYKIPESLSSSIAKVYLFDSRISYSPEYRAKDEFEAYLKILGIRALECPVPDRLAAAKAGLGKFGRNNFIYHPEHGSYIWIDTWVTDKELDYDALADDIYVNACNDNCHKCIRACPTKALCGSLSMDFGRCVTQLQCSGKDRPDDKTMARMGQWLYGCDACQDACPLNKYKFTDTAEFPLLSEIGEYLKLETILEMDEDTYLNIIYPRFWYMGKEGLWLWKCNALRSMVNSGETGYHGLIKKYCDHEDKRVSETAQWGCGKLGI